MYRVCLHKAGLLHQGVICPRADTLRYSGLNVDCASAFFLTAVKLFLRYDIDRSFHYCDDERYGEK